MILRFLVVGRQAQRSKHLFLSYSTRIPDCQSLYLPTKACRTFSTLTKPDFLQKREIVRLFSKQAENSSDSGKNDAGADNSEEEISKNKKLTTRDRLKVITTQYGAFGMAFHITISLASLGMFYFLVYSGVDFAPFMAYIGMKDSKIATGASTFVIAYAVHKVFAPVRIGITFVSVPVLVRHFRKIGFFKK